MIDKSWIPAFYERERKARDIRKAERKGSFRARTELFGWAREENQFHLLTVQMGLSTPTRQQMWFMMRPPVRWVYWKPKNACPVCRDAYLRRDGNKYIHRDYGQGAYMYHTDDTE